VPLAVVRPPAARRSRRCRRAVAANRLRIPVRCRFHHGRPPAVGTTGTAAPREKDSGRFPRRTQVGALRGPNDTDRDAAV